MDFKKKRQWMIDSQLRRRGIHDKKVLAAFAAVQREDFVPLKYLNEAYDDHPLPIGDEQTISQPYIVALMLEKLRFSGEERVLEIGTGSGYQTAILARLARHVYTVERNVKLISGAKRKLNQRGDKNISYLHANGTLGWPEESPYDRIIVSAASPELPGPLREQLVLGGLIVLPLGLRLVQRLMVGEKKRTKLKLESVCGCSFVSLVGELGFKE